MSEYIEIKSGNCTYKLVQNENTHKYIAKITALEKRHANMFKTARRRPVPIKPSKATLTLDELVLSAINAGMAYAEVLKTFSIKNYQPFKTFGATQWERVKVTA